MKDFLAQGFCWLACVGALLAGAGLESEARAAPKKDDHLRFTITATASDPFSDANAASRSAAKPLEVRRGETLKLVIQGTPLDGWHTYSIHQRAEGQIAQSSEVKLQPSAAFAALGPVVESQPKYVDKPDDKAYEFDEPFTWTIDVLVRPTAPVGSSANLVVDVNAQVCHDTLGCTFQKDKLTVPVTILDGDPLPVSAEVEGLLKKYDQGSKDQTAEKPSNLPARETLPSGFDWRDLTVVDQTGDAHSRSDSGLWSTIVTAILGGLISLATPCVFPMIPITVSFFIKQAETRHGNALVMAGVYSGTIVLVLTAGGMALVSVLQMISQHWITNVFLATVFIVFALSLLGMFELTLPTSLSDLTSSKQGSGGYAGIIFMALTFSIISFACVGPIYGGFITLEAAQQGTVTGWLQRFLGPFAFAIAFASPFFVLALFPRLLKAMPRSGSWMNSVKVVMGFLELAAAFKFIRSAELGLLARTEYFTYDLVLGIYVVLAIACGLYLLGVYRLPHDHEAPESIGVMRLIFSLVFLSIGLYLVPGLFKDDKHHSQKPRGVVYDWVQAFLLPDDGSTWGANLPQALAQAERENKPLFIDFTGVTCPNCRLNENRVFSKPRIEELFRRYVTLQLHTDQVPVGIAQVPDARESTEFRDEKFKNYALPYYVIARIKDRTLYVLYKHETGLINNVEEFASVLNKYATKQTP